MNSILRALAITGALILGGCSRPEVVVLDSSGTPVVGAKVVGTSLSIGGQATFTDKKGEARIPRAVQDTKWISIYKDGYLPAENIDATRKPIVVRMTKLPK